MEAAGSHPVRFTWTKALFGKYDLVHFHWPEHLFVASTVLKRVPKVLAGAIFLVRLLAFRVPIVLTQHNLAAHEETPGYVRFLTSRLERMIDVRIYLNESPENDPDLGVVILHHVYPRTPEEARIAGRQPTITTFGSLRPYKGIEGLVSAFGEAKASRRISTEARLTIVGQASSPEYAATISQMTEACPGASFRPGYIDEPALEALILESTAVALPYKSMYNSGAAILALGLGARILIPSSPSTEALKREFPEAVSTYKGTPSSADVAAILSQQAGASVDAGPFRRRRSLETVGRLHADLYSVLGRLPRWWTRQRRRQSTIAEIRRSFRFRSHSQRNAVPSVTERHS
ncbi:hypothetical protein [Zhihengliuella sp.]|uniref:hypothetical protein n=1 Tax=Zhihengliuella sp. TaxID=1954483 RepID=UPI0028112A14|nr:hypothetical protein [Zhihengliuella sp.]